MYNSVTLSKVGRERGASAPWWVESQGLCTFRMGVFIVHQARVVRYMSFSELQPPLSTRDPVFRIGLHGPPVREYILYRLILNDEDPNRHLTVEKFVNHRYFPLWAVDVPLSVRNSMSSVSHGTRYADIT
jgi:hypothetical protein